MAERRAYRPAFALLPRFDGALLEDAACYLAGGAAVAVRCQEYRISHDVDFLCASREGYRTLRERVYRRGVRGLFERDVEVRRELRADRYGIRCVIDVDRVPVKVEIVSEGRIDLAGDKDERLGVPRLSDDDLVASKLLANEDRFLDEGALARDILDLIMLEEVLGELPPDGWGKARAAYGPSVEDAYRRSLERLAKDPGLLARAFEKLSVTTEAQKTITRRLRR